MPVVRMRRTSRRVFGTRVLRSGRRVMMSSPTESKHAITLLQSSRDDIKSANRKLSPKSIENVNLVSEKKWGMVYSRKRKRLDCVSEDWTDRMFGKFYVRKRKWLDSVERRFLGVFIECDKNGFFGSFLESVLRYMTRSELDLSKLVLFVLTGSFARAFSSRGIRFSRGCLLNKSSGVCKIFEARRFIPSFVVDFSALPSCFMYLNTTLLLRSACFSIFLSQHPIKLVDNIIIGIDGMVVDEEIIEAIEQETCISTSSEADSLGMQFTPSVSVSPGRKSSFKTSFRAPRTSSRSVQFKTGIITRSIQKRRSSLRSKRVQSSYPLCGRIANGALVCSLMSLKHDRLSLSPPVKSGFQLNSARRSTSLSSSLVELRKDIDSSSCTASVLVVEDVKCYRIVGAAVELEETVSRKWFLAVKRDGKTIYCLDAHNAMRPCSSNRITRDIIWRDENTNWKLEFPDRGDWLIFKDLYKECCERNMQSMPANVIPVPGVVEVPDYEETYTATFCRPHLYITVRDGELSRAMAKKTSIYDMDSEDEKWVKEFNDASSLRNEHLDHLSEDTFEMIIDALEKAIFNNPDDYSDEKLAVGSCLHLVRKEVVEAVYSYWMRKRRQKRGALVQVFQLYQPRRTQLLLKPVIRKKRSFNRQAKRPDRAKPQTVPPVVRGPNPAEKQKAVLKVEEAKAATSRSVAAAIEKRKRAQLLMEKADSATYKAAMAMRIAEAALVAESFSMSESFLLE